MAKKDPNMKHITKMNYPKNKGYWVRFTKVHIKNEKLIYQKYFPISRYGSWENALKEAIKYRDEIKNLLNDSLIRRRFKKIPQKNNKTKVLGVHRGSNKVKMANGTYKNYYYWAATGSIDEKKQIKFTFYETRLGKEKAKKLAIKARREIIKKIREKYEVDDSL